MPILTITRPHVRYRGSFLRATYEALAKGTNPPWNLDMLSERFEEYVQTILEKESDPMAGLVPETVYWSVVDEQYVGRASLRHHLAGDLINYGGHIGYEVRPSARRKGYGRQQCALVLQKAWAQNLARVLITCDDDNIGSIQIIESNGGILENRVDNGRATLTRRYWISRPLDL